MNTKKIHICWTVKKMTKDICAGQNFVPNTQKEKDAEVAALVKYDYAVTINPIGKENNSKIIAEIYVSKINHEMLNPANPEQRRDSIFYHPSRMCRDVKVTGSVHPYDGSLNMMVNRWGKEYDMDYKSYRESIEVFEFAVAKFREVFAPFIAPVKDRDRGNANPAA